MFSYARRTWWIAFLVLMASVSAACDGGTEPAAETIADSTTAADVGSDAPPEDPISIDDVDGATRRDIIATLRGSVEALYAGPVRIDAVLDEEGTPTVVEARVDRGAELAEVREVRSPSPDVSITTQRVVIDGRAFFKSTTGPEAEAALDFTEVTFERSGRETLDDSFTALGRLGPSLERIIELLEELPFDAQITEGETGLEISVVMSPFAIYDYYAETGLEAVGGNVPQQPTRFAFLLDDGMLLGIAADGTHFHDGEALDIEASVTFEPIEPFTLEIPPLQEN